MQALPFFSVLFALALALTGGALAAGPEDNWSAVFGPNGANDDVRSSVTFEGDLVVGGDFTQVGGVAANRIARWDGTTWTAFGDGFDREVQAVHVHDGVLYAGGYFEASGAAPIRSIARWTGSQWVEVGGGLDGGVADMETFGVDLIVAGDFTSANEGTVSAEGVIRWDGSAWSDLNTGFFNIDSGWVSTLAVYQGKLHAGGFFLGASGIAVGGPLGDPGHIAAYNGSTWDVLDGGVLGSEDPYGAEVIDLEVFDGSLFVAGIFDSTGDGQAADGLARWDGSQWTGEVAFDLDSTSTLAVHDGWLYIGAFNVLTRRAANGSLDFQFFAAGTGGVGGSYIVHMASHGTDLLIGGDFGFLGETGVNNLALHDGTTVRSIEGRLGVDDIVRLAVEWNGQLVAGGTFVYAGDTPGTQGLAAFDGTSWSSLGGGITSSRFHAVLSMVVHDGDLIVGGSFTQIGGVSVNRVARWDGVTWTPMGSGSVSTVTALYDWNGTLYAHMDPTPGSGSICRWDGIDWVVVGQDTFGGDAVQMASYGGQLVVAGQMNSIAGVPVNHIAAFDGVNWTSFEGGVSGGSVPRIFGMVTDGSSLYLAGDFTLAGATPVSGVARWDGGAWSDMSGGVAGGGRGLTLFEGDLVVAGGFATAGASATPVNNLARFDGASWSAFGSGVSGGVANCVIASGSDLFVGGNFTAAGGKLSQSVALWSTSTATSVESTTSASLHVAAAPNPFSTKTSIAFSLERATPVEVSIHDARGRRIDRIELGTVEPGMHRFQWDGRDHGGRRVTSGIYFVLVTAGPQSVRTKVSYVR